jgi:hypothetical protein
MLIVVVFIFLSLPKEPVSDSNLDYNYFMNNTG